MHIYRDKYNIYINLKINIKNNYIYIN